MEQEKVLLTQSGLEKLEQEKIDYLFEIAGIGDYYEELSG